MSPRSIGRGLNVCRPAFGKGDSKLQHLRSLKSGPQRMSVFHPAATSRGVSSRSFSKRRDGYSGPRSDIRATADVSCLMASLIRRVQARPSVALAVVVLTCTAVVAAIGLVDPRGEFRLQRHLFAPKEDGNWAALSIDGKKVAPSDYRVAVLDRQVVGGRDGCNDWAYAGDADANGERMIETTLQYCPGNKLRQAYRALSYQSDANLLPDGKLQLASNGHQGIFVRCKWRTVKDSGPGWTSEVTQCVVTAR